jgi:hypothetical protein
MKTVIWSQIFSSIYMMGFVAVTATLLVTMSIFAYLPNQTFAQITPSNFQSSNIGLMGQDSADPIQNTTASNITQLATVSPTTSQPIAPASLTPVVEESDESSSTNDDDENDGNDGDDSGDDDSGDDDSGDDDSGDDDSGDGGDGGDGGDMFDGAFGGGFPFN